MFIAIHKRKELIKFGCMNDEAIRRGKQNTAKKNHDNDLGGCNELMKLKVDRFCFV